MAISFGNMIVGGVPVNEAPPTPVPPKRTENTKVIQSQETSKETHVKLKDGELERLVPKKSSYMMDLTSGSE